MPRQGEADAATLERLGKRYNTALLAFRAARTAHMENRVSRRKRSGTAKRRRHNNLQRDQDMVATFRTGPNATPIKVSLAQCWIPTKGVIISGSENRPGYISPSQLGVSFYQHGMTRTERISFTAVLSQGLLKTLLNVRGVANPTHS